MPSGHQHHPRKPYIPKSPSDIPFLITLAVASFLAGVGLTLAVVLSWG